MKFSSKLFRNFTYSLLKGAELIRMSPFYQASCCSPEHLTC